MNDILRIETRNESRYGSRTRNRANMDLPSPPQFNESLDQLRQRVAKRIGAIKVPKSVRNWHPQILRLLKADEKRLAKQDGSKLSHFLYPTHFQDRFEQRRLRILNSLFIAVAKVGGKGEISGSDGRSININFHGTHVRLLVDSQSQSRYSRQAPSERNDESDTLHIKIDDTRTQFAQQTWQDKTDHNLELQVAAIAVELATAAEAMHRDNAQRLYEWQVEQRARLKEEERQRRIEAEKAELERIEALKKARIDRLLGDATALMQAREIRAYVDAVRSAIQRGEASVESDALDYWANWALAEADRIDPVRSMSFLSLIDELKD